MDGIRGEERAEEMMLEAGMSLAGPTVHIMVGAHIMVGSIL